jgi:hypothetical protein
MTIPVVPSQFRVPAKGLVEINQLEVRVSSYSLGVTAQAYYDLQNKTTVTKSREVPNPNYSRGTYDMQTQTWTPPEPKTDLQGNVIDQISETLTETYTEEVVTSYGLNGNDSLTEEQFAGWGTDDIYFANCIAQNLGLTPVV